MNVRFDEAVRRFDLFLRVEKNLSPKTRAAYSYDLGRFSDFLCKHLGLRPQFPLHEVGTEEVRAYVHYLREERQYRPTTLARVISSLRTLFDFAIEEGIVEGNPAVGISNPRRPQKLPVYLVEEELKRLFKAPDVSQPQGMRDLAMLLVMTFCGLRLQELVGLNMIDLDFESATIRVLGKGSKERLVPMNADVVAAVHAWLEVRDAADREKAVFVNRFGRRLSGRMVQKLVDKYVQDAGISKEHLSPHKLRHTFATLLHARDTDLVDIQALLGHASIQTTQIYTHTNAGRLRGAVERLDALADG